MNRLFVIFIIFLSISAIAQQQPLFTQYYVNDLIINPAASGSKIYNPLIIQTRQQWIGFEGAPLTSNISYSGSLNNRSAMGGYLMFDQAYPTSQASLHLNYAYHIPLDYDKVNLSFGLGAKVMYHNLDFDTDDLPPGYDQAFSATSHDQIFGDASSGVYLYGNNFYAGFSVSNMLQSSFNTTVFGSPYLNQLFRNYYGLGAFRFKLINNDWKLEPSFLIRKMHFQSSITDLTTRIIYLNRTWGGLTFRTNGSASLGFGIGVKNIDISYSFDYTFSGEIMQYNYGTHELGISFRIPKNIIERPRGFSGY